MLVSGRRGLIAGLMLSASLSLAVVAPSFAQTAPAGNAGQGASSTAAMTAIEQAGVQSVLNLVNTLSGQALIDAVRDKFSEYAKSGLNVTAMASYAKAGAGNKLGAINSALAAAAAAAGADCTPAKAGCSAVVTALNDALSASPASTGTSTASNEGSTTDVQTAATGAGAGGGAAGGGAAGGGAGGGAGGVANTGTGTGNGTSAGTGQTTTGVQSVSALTTSSRTRSVSASVSR